MPTPQYQTATPPFVPSDNHWRLRYFRERITRAQLKYHLLNNPDPIIDAELWQWKHKHLGCGIYELWMEPREGK